MLANPIPLKIVPFLNPSGLWAHRVTGTVRGKRIRKNFRDPAEAQTFVNRHVPALAGATPRPVITSLPEMAVRQAEAAALKLPAGTSLLDAVDFYASHFRPVVTEKIGVAARAFGDWLAEQRKCDVATVDRRVSTIAQFAKAAKISTTAEFTAEKARAWIYDAACSVRTQRDRFDWLRAFGAWLEKERRCATNPIARLDRPIVKIDAPGVITFDETWTLLQCALTDAEGPDMLPFFAISALSGLRPAEVPRLNGWEDVHLGDEHRLIEVNKAKGGRARRNVTIGDALGKILTWCAARELQPDFFSKRKFDRIRKRAGLFERWEKDLLRHTYASHHYVVHHDTKCLSANMGNSEQVLFQHYLRPVALTEGQKMEGLCLHYTMPRAKSAMGTGPKPRRKKAAKASATQEV